MTEQNHTKSLGEIAIDGEQVGRLSDGFLGHCPYDHTTDQAMFWVSGYLQGRKMRPSLSGAPKSVLRHSV